MKISRRRASGGLQFESRNTQGDKPPIFRIGVVDGGAYAMARASTSAQSRRPAPAPRHDDRHALVRSSVRPTSPRDGLCSGARRRYSGNVAPMSQPRHTHRGVYTRAFA